MTITGIAIAIIAPTIGNQNGAVISKKTIAANSTMKATPINFFINHNKVHTI